MNGTWLVFVSILFIVLVAVAIGAQQTQTQQALELSQLTEQRKTVLDLSNEATAQRNAAFAERDAAVAALTGANNRIAALEEDARKSAQLLDEATNKATALQQQVADQQAKTAALQQQLDEQKAQVAAFQQQAGTASTLEQQLREQTSRAAALEQQLAEQKANYAALAAQDASEKQKGIPVTSWPNTGEKIPVRQLGMGLAVLIGMAALGSGGYVVYRNDPNRKYSVKMTRDQIQAYARYQRERGNRAA